MSHRSFSSNSTASIKPFIPYPATFSCTNGITEHIAWYIWQYEMKATFRIS